MMSQKSLKNNVNRNDFKRSLVGSIPFPAIALVVLFLGLTVPVLEYVTSDAFKDQVYPEVSMFLSSNSLFAYSFYLIPIGMVLCGMLTAIKSFYFMLSKKQVNVFFSMGVNRKTMFINRTLSAIITLFVAVLVPMLITYITNIVCFGYSAHQTEVFLYGVSLLFVCGLSGYAVATASMMISGNIFEAVLTCATSTIMPILFPNLIQGFCINFLNGYVVDYNADTSWQSVLTPWGIAVNLGDDYVMGEWGYSEKTSPLEIFEVLRRTTTPDKFEIPEKYQIDMGFMLPIIIWLAVSVVLITLGAVLYKARKAEHANSFGHFAISRAINGSFVFVVLTYILAMVFDGMVGPFVFFLIVALAGAVAYFLVQLIMTRKLKATLKSLKWYGVLVSVTAMALVITSTGFFGAYNKTPEKAELKSVSLEATELMPYEHYIHMGDSTEDFVESSTDESMETAIKAFELLKKEKIKYNQDSLCRMMLVFRDKNNELKYREFAIYSEETYYEYLKLVYGSDYFDAILEEYLLNDPPAIDEDIAIEYSEDTYMEYLSDVNDSAGYLKQMSWLYIGNNMLLELEEYEVEQDQEPIAPYIENSEELCKALYNDLSKMTFEQLFHNTSKPLGILATGGNYDVCLDKNGYVYPLNEYGVADDIEAVQTEDEVPTTVQASFVRIPVYREMTETVKYLENHGYEINELDLTIEEVFYTDSPLDVNSVLQVFAEENSHKYTGWGDYTHYLIDEPYDMNMFLNSDFGGYAVEMAGYFVGEKVNNLDMLKQLYKTAEHPLVSVKDTAKTEEIINKSVSQYLIYGDKGRYVYVVYEEGPIVCYYLPEANVSVLK